MNAMIRQSPAPAKPFSGVFDPARFAGVILAAAILHFIITPAESAGSGFALYLRFALAIAAAVAVLLTHMNQPLLYRLPLPLCLLALFIMSINFPTTTWYAVVFSGFSLAMAVCSVALVAGPWQRVLRTAVDVVLFGWVSIFLLQMLAWHGAGLVVDFHHWIHPYSEARIFADGESAVMRLTGPHIEPGTYANWVYGLILLRSILRRRWFDLPALAVMATTLLTFSLWSMIAAVFYFGAALLSALSSFRTTGIARLLGLLLVLSALVAFLPDTLLTDAMDYLSYRVSADDGSGNSKMDAWTGFMRELVNVLVIGRPFHYDYCDGCPSPQDAGLFVNLVVRLGLLPALLLLAVVARGGLRTGGWTALVAMVPMLFAKFYVFDPIVWLIVGVCFLGSQRSSQVTHHPRRARIIHGGPHHA